MPRMPTASAISASVNQNRTGPRRRGSRGRGGADRRGPGRAAGGCRPGRSRSGRGRRRRTASRPGLRVVRRRDRGVLRDRRTRGGLRRDRGGARAPVPGQQHDGHDDAGDGQRPGEAEAAPRVADQQHRGEHQHGHQDEAEAALVQVDHRLVAVVLGQQQPQGAVEQQPGAAEEGEHHEEHPHDRGVDVEVPGDAAGDAGDVLLAAGRARSRSRSRSWSRVTRGPPGRARGGRCFGRCALSWLQPAASRRSCGIGDDPDPHRVRGPRLGVGSGFRLMVRPRPLCDDGATMSATPVDPAPHRRPRGPRCGAPRLPRHPGADHRRRRRRARDAPRRAGLWVRAAFVLFTALGGLGIALYAGLWMVLPVRLALLRGRARASRARPAPASDPAGSAGSPTSGRPSRSAALALRRGHRGRGGARRRRRSSGRWSSAMAGHRAAVAAGRRGPARALGRLHRPDRPGQGRLRQRRLGVVRPRRRRARC